MLRLTGGAFKGRGIYTPKNIKTRPTQAKLRQALFNSLQANVPGAKVLDLFAGSGALGFEALSRGAYEVVFVEGSKPVAELIRKNTKLLDVENQTHILNCHLTDTADLIHPRWKEFWPFDLIFADPPYDADWELKLLLKMPWSEQLSPDGLFCIEWGSQRIKELPKEVPFLEKVREKNYGDSMLTTYAGNSAKSAGSQ